MAYRLGRPPPAGRPRVRDVLHRALYATRPSERKTIHAAGGVANQNPVSPGK